MINNLLAHHKHDIWLDVLKVSKPRKQIMTLWILPKIEQNAPRILS